MSQQIDNQIVKMQFDNASFEKNAHETMSTLEKLKQMLHFDKVNMTPLQQAFSETENTATKAGLHIRDIWLKMSTIIENQVAEKIVNTGKKIANALTLEGVTDGFKEYELKMGSIQTIMAGTGESLATVNKYLDELNTYSDKTIYSFADMTSNIGKFTNAGVKLGDAVAAIKGIANEAAVSGANANEASRAMYNFSQALSAGYVKLIDWKSIENANMATKEFKQTLIDVAQGIGTVKRVGDDWQTTTTNMQGKVSDLFNSTKGFNDSLNHQWMTTEVLNNALEIYATDIRDASVNVAEYERHLREDLKLSDEQIEKYEQLGIKAANAATEIKTFTMLIDTLKEAIGSGWAMSWQYIIGDFEQAKALWTDVGKTVGGVIDSMSEARNNFLKQGLRTGWEKTIAGGGLKDIIPDAEKFRTILVDLARQQGILSKDQYVSIVDTNTFMKSLHEGRWMTGDLLKEAVNDYRDILKSMSDVELENAGFTKEDIASLDTFSASLALDTDKAEEFASAMNELGGRENVIQGLSNVFQSLLATLKPIGEAFNNVFGVFDPNKLFELTKRFREFTEELKVSEDAANTIRTSFTLVFGGIKTIIGAVGTTVSGVTKLILPLLNLFDAVFGLIGKVVAALTGSKGALDAADKFGKIGDKISDKYLWAMQKLADFINKVADAIRGIPEATIFVKIHNGVEKAIESLQRFWDSFVNLPIVQQMIQDFNNTIDDIERRLTPVVDAVEKAFDDLKKKIDKTFSLDTLNKVLTVTYNKVKQFITIIKDFTTRIKTFFSNLKQGKSVVESFKESFGDIIEKIKELKENATDFFEKLFEKSNEMGDKFNLDQIQQAIHNFVTNITPDQVTMIAVAGSFMLIAINLLRLSEAMRNAVEAFTGIGVALKNVINSYIKKQKSTILQVAEAIVIVAASLWVLSEIPKEKLENAVGALKTIALCLIGLTATLVGAGAAMKFIGGERTLVELATGLVLVAGSFMVAALSLKVLEYVNLDGIFSKIVTMGVIMAGLAGISLLIAKLDKFNKGSLTMVAIAGALVVMSQALVNISSIPLEKIDASIATIYKVMIGLAALTFAAGKVGIFSAVGLIAIILTLDKILPIIEKIVNYDYAKIEKGIEQNKKVLKKLGEVIGVMVIIGAIAGNRIKGAGIAMMSIAVVFGVLLGIAKLASLMRPADLKKGEDFLLKMAGLIALLELCSERATLGSFGGKNGGEGSKVYMRLAMTMGILLGVAKLASMMEPAALVKGTIAVAALSGLIYLMIRVAKTAKNSEGLMKSVTLMIFTISLILGEVALLSMIPIQNMAPALGAILAIILSLAVLAKAISANTKIFDKATMKSSGVGALIVSMIMIGVLGRILWDLSKESPKNVATAGAAMSGVIVAVAAITKALGSIDGDFSKAQLQSFIGAVGAMLVVAAVIGGLSWFVKELKIDPNSVLKAAGAITIVLAGLVPVLDALSGFTDEDFNAKSMWSAFGGAIGILVVAAAAIGALSNWGGDGDKMIKSSIALAIALIAVSAPIAVLGAVGQLCKDAKAGTMVWAVVGAIGALAAVAIAIGKLSNYGNPDTMMLSAKSLAVALLAISVPIAVLGAVGVMCKGMGLSGGAGMALSVVGAVGALWAVTEILVNFGRKLDISTLQILNDAMPVLVVTMASVGVLSLAIAAAGRIAKTAKAALAGGLAIVEALVIFAIIIAAITGFGAALNGIKGSKEALITGLVFLKLIFEKIAETIAAIVTGIGVGLTNGLYKIGDNLSAFAEHIKPFVLTMEDISDEAVTGCKNLAAAMLYLASAKFVDSVGKLVGFGSFKDFNFGAIGIGITDFCNAVKTIPKDSLSKANTCSIIAKRLAEMNTYFEAKGGLAKLIFGDKESLDEFAKGVKSFGTAVHDFCKEVEEVPPNAVDLAQRAADAVGPMIDLTSQLVADGGLLQDIIGHQNLAEFGTRLVDFASGLTEFVKALITLETTDANYGDIVQRCADATTPMTNLANNLNALDGLWQEVFAGEKDLGKFGATLKPFADGLKEFLDAMDTVIKDHPDYATTMTSTATAVSGLAEIAKGLPKSGGAFSAFTGQKSLQRFGWQIESFGESIAKFATSIAEVNADDISKLNTAIGDILDMATKAAEVPKDAFDSIKNAMTDISGMSVAAMSSELTYSSELLLEAITTLLQDAKDLVAELAEKDTSYYGVYGKAIITGIINAIQIDKPALLIPEIYSLVASIMLVLQTEMAVTKFVIFGKNVLAGIKGGLFDEEYVKALHDAAYGVGYNISLGVAEGIEAGTETAVNAAKAMAEAVLAELPEVAKEHSPSEITYEDGKNLVLGIINAITDYTADAVQATTDMSEAIVSTANGIISDIAKVIDSNVDAQPTIRPVLDTTDVENKAKTIGKMFDSSDLRLAYTASGYIRKSAEEKANAKYDTINEQKPEEGNASQIINYTQNNYSPKALSRTEIYRQTKNQISMLKGR